jgi:hypothetical protein
VHHQDVESLCNLSFSNDIEGVTNMLARKDILEFVNLKNERGKL